MGQPQKIKPLVSKQANEMFSNMPPEIAEQARREFNEWKALRSSGAVDQESFQKLNGYERMVSRPSRSVAMVKLETIPPNSPLVIRATMAEAREAVANIAYMFGHNIGPDFLNDVAREIVEGEWTQEELRLARYWIPKNPKLCKEINYNRTVTPAVFTAARALLEVSRGRLMPHGQACDVASENEKPLGQLFKPVTFEGKTWFMVK